MGLELLWTYSQAGFALGQSRRRRSRDRGRHPRIFREGLDHEHYTLNPHYMLG